MQESDVYDLFDSINHLTQGMFAKEHTLKKVYHRKAQDGELELSTKKVKDSLKGILISGPPEKVGAYLMAFFRGVNFGMGYALKIFSKEPKIKGCKSLAHLLHKNFLN